MVRTDVERRGSTPRWRLRAEWRPCTCGRGRPAAVSAPRVRA